MINKTKNRKASDLRMFETSSRGRIRQSELAPCKRRFSASSPNRAWWFVNG